VAGSAPVSADTVDSGVVGGSTGRSTGRLDCWGTLLLSEGADFGGHREGGGKSGYRRALIDGQRASAFARPRPRERARTPARPRRDPRPDA